MIFLSIKEEMDNYYTIWIQPFKNIHNHNDVILYVSDLMWLQEDGLKANYNNFFVWNWVFWGI